MLSRVASSIYWMSRYLERADNVTRFIDVNANLILDMGRERKDAQWEPLVRATGDEEIFNNLYKEYNEKNVINFLTFNKKNPNSIISCIHNFRENSRTIREVISSEMWEVANALYHLVMKHSRKHKIDDLQEFFIEIHNYNSLFTGFIENTMLHDEGWHFARIGRLLERADKTARMLDVKYFFLLPNLDYIDTPYDAVEWGSVLKSVNGFEMYRKQFHRVNYKNVSEFLILNEHFPRAIRYCIHSISRSLQHIINTLGVDVLISLKINKLRITLDEANINYILDNDIHKFVDNLQLKFNAIDEELDRIFFNTTISV